MILLLASRYSFSRMNRHFWRSVRIMVSLAFSTAVLISVLSVMDYLQTSRMDDIRNVKSFDIVVRGADEEAVRALYPDCTVFTYCEEMALVDGHAMAVRYVDQFYEGGVELLAGGCSGAVIPYSLYREFGADDISMNLLHGNTLRDLKTVTYPVSGVYSTSLGSSFDPLHVFLPLYMADESLARLVAVKGSDDTSALDAAGIEYVDWKESESTLYSAFILERAMMVFILSFLFLIIFFQIRQEIRVFISIKRKEMVELYVMGMDVLRTAFAFTLSFVFLVLCSLASGLAFASVFLFFFSKRISVLSYTHVVLSISWGTFATLCLVMVALAALSCMACLAGDRGRTPLEVLDGR